MSDLLLKRTRFLIRLSAVSLLTVLMLAILPSARAAEAQKWDERQDRNVDRVALRTKAMAISQFETLLKRYRGTDSEAQILVKLMDAETEAAEYEFRIAVGDARLKNQTENLSKYNARLHRVIDHANELIKRFPSEEELDRINFFRAHAYDELKDKASAKKYYDFVADHFPHTSWAIKADMALADYATDDQNHKLAIEYLKRVEAEPDDPHFATALYKLSWEYFNLEDTDSAVSYIKRNIGVYQARKKLLEQSEDEEFTDSDQALLDHSYRDYVLFYFDGYDKGKSGYDFDRALTSFRAVDPGDSLGNMMLVFAQLFRSRDRTDDLDRWKQLAVKEEITRPETADIVSLNFEYNLDHHLITKLPESAHDFVDIDAKTNHKMREYENYPKYQKLLLDAATDLQNQVMDKRDDADKRQVNKILAAVDLAFASIVEDTDPRVGEVHYNLAEIWFSLTEYEDATAEYDWVLKHWQEKSRLKKIDVQLKAVSSAYLELKAKKQLAGEVKLTQLDPNESSHVRWDKLDKKVASWIKRVDDYEDDWGRTPPAIEDFEYETDRILYSNGQIRPALKRISKLIHEDPSSASASAGATLSFDTMVLSENWDEAVPMARDFLRYEKLGDPAFRARLAKLPGDVAYKVISAKYKDKLYPEVVTLAYSFDKEFPASEHRGECLLMGARSAMELKQEDKALFLTGEIIKSPESSPERSAALLTKAQLEESSYDFDSASHDYQEYLTTSGKEESQSNRAEITKRYLLVVWLSREPLPLDCTPYEKSDDVFELCDRYQALAGLQSKKPIQQDPVERMSKGPKANRALWAALALRNYSALKLKDRLNAANVLASGYSDQSPVVQFSLTPSINELLPQVYISAQKELPSLAKLKVSSGALKRRIELIQLVENSASKAISLPWSEVKIALVSTIAQLYFDFCNELGKLQPPKDLPADQVADYKKQIADILGPFEAKAKTLQTQAVNLASESPVNPALVAGMEPPPVRKPAMELHALDVTLLDGLGAPIDPTVKVEPNPIEQKLRANWLGSLKEGNWARIAFFTQEYKEKVSSSDMVTSGMRALALDRAHAQPEAITEVLSLKSQTKGKKRRQINEFLYALYFNSSLSKKSDAIADEIVSDQLKAWQEERIKKAAGGESEEAK